jgi:hypothetical protein
MTNADAEQERPAAPTAGRFFAGPRKQTPNTKGENPMFDFPLDMEDEHLTYGPILEGSQKPSEVLDAMLPYLEWGSHKQMEWGMDFVSAMTPYLMAEALKCLCRSSSHYDVSLEESEDEFTEELEVMVLHGTVRSLIEHLDDFTAPGQRFGFDRGDLGVWTDWPSIDDMIEKGDCVEIGHPAEIDKLDGKIRFALLDEGESLTFYAVSDGSVIWSI